MSDSNSDSPALFLAGPCPLPAKVLEDAASAVRCFPGTKLSLLSLSHRCPEFDAVVREASALVCELTGACASDYHVLWMQGGASMQFAACALNLLQLHHGKDSCAPPKACYRVEGTWARKAAEEARKLGISVTENAECAENVLYSYVCTNETVDGLAVGSSYVPPKGAKYHVADMSSDFLTRPTPRVEQFDIVFAGAQKNVGAAGVTIVIVKKNLIAAIEAQAKLGNGTYSKMLPTMLSYTIAARSESVYNTPPVYAIFVSLLMLRWTRSVGMKEIFARALAKADALYRAIDSLKSFKAIVAREVRSNINVVFRIVDPATQAPSVSLEEEFIKECESASPRALLGLRGHRSVGGLRASLYNAVTMEDVELLVSMMQKFDEKQK